MKKILFCLLMFICPYHFLIAQEAVTITSPFNNENFGIASSVNDNYLAISARVPVTDNVNGKIVVYRKENNNWVIDQELAPYPENTASSYRLVLESRAMDIFNETIVAGMHNENAFGWSIGGAGLEILLHYYLVFMQK